MKICNISTLLILLSLSTSLRAGFEGGFSYEKFLRLNTPSKKTEAVDWSGISLTFKDRFKETEVFGEANLRYYFNGPEAMNYSFPEFYHSIDTNDSNFTYGRKIVDWSLNEKYWQVGHLNPRQGFNLLSSKQEGLTAFHYTKNVTKSFDVGIVFSYLYIPTLNPSIDIKDGKVVSNSEWVRKPPEKTVVLGNVVPIKYQMNKPKAKDVLLKKTLGINGAYKWKGGALSSYAIYKPENNLRVNAEASLANDGSHVLAIANPVVNHHLMYGFQGKQKFGDVQTVLSFDVTDPNAKLGDDFEVLNPLDLKEDDRNFTSEYFTIQPNYDKESYLTASASIDRTYYSLSLNYIHLMSENKRGSDDFYSETVKWKRTVGVMGKVMWTEELFTLADYRYDLARADHILKFEVDYMISRDLSFRLGAELIKSPLKSSYWSAYRANDTVYSSLNYLF